MNWYKIAKLKDEDTDDEMGENFWEEHQKNLIGENYGIPNKSICPKCGKAGVHYANLYWDKNQIIYVCPNCKAQGKGEETREGQFLDLIRNTLIADACVKFNISYTKAKEMVITHLGIDVWRTLFQRDDNWHIENDKKNRLKKARSQINEIIDLFKKGTSLVDMALTYKISPAEIKDILLSALSLEKYQQIAHRNRQDLLSPKLKAIEREQSLLEKSPKFPSEIQADFQKIIKGYYNIIVKKYFVEKISIDEISQKYGLAKGAIEKFIAYVLETDPEFQNKSASAATSSWYKIAKS